VQDKSGPKFGPGCLIFNAKLLTRFYLTESIYKASLQEKKSSQIRQHASYVSNDNGYVDGFVWKLIFGNDLIITLCEVNFKLTPSCSGAVSRLSGS